MSSLRQILATHGPALVIDAASSLVQVGWVTAHESRWHESEDEAGKAIFEGVRAVTEGKRDYGALVYCEGPGSILGVRSAAMAIRTWSVLRLRPVFAYLSLALVAESLGETGATVIADARRDTWHAFRRGDVLRRVTPAELTPPLLMPTHFRCWGTPPQSLRPVDYKVSTLLNATLDADLLHPVVAPDAFLHEEPSYLTWTPQIHRAPTSS